MARAADEGGSGPPFAKFVDLGDTLVGAFASNAKECRRQARDFTTNEPKIKNNGDPQYEEVMYFVAMPGTTAKTGNAETEMASISEETEVRFAVSGFKWSQVIEGRKALGPHAGFKAGQPCSGDVYTIRLVGWSAETKNADAASKAGFTVVEGRIVLRSQEDKDRYVLAQSRNGGNTNPAKDYEISIRRPEPGEKRWEQAADELFDRAPWRRQPAAVGASSSSSAQAEAEYEEPF